MTLILVDIEPKRVRLCADRMHTWSENFYLDKKIFENDYIYCASAGDVGLEACLEMMNNPKGKKVTPRHLIEEFSRIFDRYKEFLTLSGELIIVCKTTGKVWSVSVSSEKVKEEPTIKIIVSEIRMSRIITHDDKYTLAQHLYNTHGFKPDIIFPSVAAYWYGCSKEYDLVEVKRS